MDPDGGSSNMFLSDQLVPYSFGVQFLSSFVDNSRYLYVPGSLALFCAACPQPGINLKEGWQDEPNKWALSPFYLIGCWVFTPRYIYRLHINPDGNFAAQHMKMRRPDLDVPLTDGEGYCVQVAPYEAHLVLTGDVKEVLTIAFLVPNGWPTLPSSEIDMHKSEGGV